MLKIKVFFLHNTELNYIALTELHLKYMYMYIPTLYMYTVEELNLQFV